MTVSARETRGRRGRRLLRIAGIAAGLLALYAAAGFVLVPWLVQTRLPEITQREIGHRATVGEVRFNPFKLLFEASELRLDEPDGTRIFGLRALTVDLEWSSLFQRTWRLALVRLVAPQVNLAISKEGRFNLADLIAAFKREPSREKQPLPRLLIDRFELNAGKVDFNDRRAGYANSVTPIEFAISDLSTLPDHNGPYTFSANTARGGAIRWKGEASLNPIAGRGQLQLESISLPDIDPYAKPFTDAALESGKLGATLPYRFAYADGKLSFDLEKAILKVVDLNARLGAAGAPSVAFPLLEIDALDASMGKREFAVGSIKLADLAVRLAGATEAALKLPGVAVGRIAGSAASGDVTVESITLAGGNLTVRRDARGQIDLLNLPVSARGAPRPAPAAAATPPVSAFVATTAPAGGASAAVAQPWKVAVKQVALDNFVLAYGDLTAPKPLQLDVGKLAVKFALQAMQVAAGYSVVVSDAEFSAKEVVAGGKTNGAVRIGELGAGGAKLDLAARTLAVERAWLRNGDLKVAVDATGRLNLLELVPGPGSAPADPVRDAAPPFKVGVKSVEISGVTTDFEDKASGIRVRALDAGARLSGVSSNLADPLDFEASLKLREGGDLRARGRVVPAAASVEAVVKVERLALAPLQPLLARYVNLTLASGSVSADGRLQVGGKGAQVRYAGAVGLVDLLLNEDGGKQFAALRSAVTEGIALQLSPNSLEVPELRLDAPQAQLLIAADRSWNAARLLVQPPAREEVPAATKVAAGAGAMMPPVAGATATVAAPIAGSAPPQADPFPVSVRRLRINNAKLDFEDLSLRPQFGARIHELGGVITGLSTNSATRSRLELDGRVDEFGLARIRGELNPFYPRYNTEVNVVFRNIDMTTATPYAMKFAGYKIAAGKISLDLNYKVRRSLLEGDNQVVIEKLTLGERVDSPDALNLPLELAIAILRDSDGRIDLGLPVSGSLDDPQFSYGAVIWKAVVSVLTRIVTAPFRALGALFGGDGANLEAIDFDPGSAAILPPEREKLRQVVQVLSKRAQLKLSIPGRYSEAADAPVLRDKAMRREILGRAGVKLAEAEEPGPLDITDRAQRAALREVFTARHGAAALEQVRVDADRGALPAQAGDQPSRRAPVSVWRRALNLAQGEPSVSDQGAYYNAIAARLAGSQPLAPDALPQLAGARSSAIAAALKDAGIDAARVDQPAVEQTEAKGKVVPLKLGLASRPER